MSLVLDEHRELLADNVRLAAFEAALQEVIRPDHVVLDLASGTGILGLLACKAGARRVYSVDAGSIVQLGREIAAANGMGDRLITIKSPSSRVELPERVDLVVADQIGRFGFEAGIVAAFADARARLLKPGGRMMPSRIDLMIAPVTAPQVRQWIDFWTERRFGIDLTPAFATAVNTGYPLKLRADQTLGSPCCLTAIDFAAEIPGAIACSTSMRIDRPGTLHGIGGWFEAQLSDRVRLTNSPLVEDSIGRRNVVLPIQEPVAVQPGDSVHVSMTIMHEQVHLRWDVDVLDAAGVRHARFRHSTWRGMLLCAEDLERTRPDRSVSLSAWGLARRTVLELCDGRRTPAEIEAALRLKHPDLFPTAASASLFVAEVVVPYGQ